ncbi:MAG: hypothetical protein ACEPO2_07090 [Pelagibaca sp.]
MPKVLEVNAVNFLKAGALGIGEEHNDPAGRRLVKELIDKGVVKKLFVELAKNTERFSRAMAAANAKAAEGGNIEEIASVAPCGDLDRLNEIPLNHLIAYALFHGAQVFLADDRSMAKLRGGNFDIRHAQIRDTFKEATGQGAAKWYSEEAKGCLFLWGGAHFDHKTKSHLDDANFIYGLPWIEKG